MKTEGVFFRRSHYRNIERQTIRFTISIENANTPAVLASIQLDNDNTKFERSSLSFCLQFEEFNSTNEASAQLYTTYE